MKTTDYKRSWLSVLFLLILSAAMVLVMTGCGDKTEAEEEKSFTFEVYCQSGEVKTFTVESNQKTVGAALTEQGLIEGEDGPYGLMVLSVDGERHVYEEDGTYWAFYVNGEYAMSGVDTTSIIDGSVYAFKAEKG